MISTYRLVSVISSIGFVFFAGVAAASTGQPSSYCSSVTVQYKQVLSYCVLSTAGASIPKNVIYYIHGNGGSAQDVLNPQFSGIYDILTKLTGKETPYLVGLSFGPQTIIDNRGTTIEDLANIAIPQIEAELGYVTPPVRHLVGASLGGFDALNFAAAKPKLFKSLSALCPAVIAFNPYSDPAATAYIQRNQPWANSTEIGSLINQLRQMYPSSSSWQQNNPMVAVKAGKLKSLPIYVSTGAQDDYGFFEGAQFLVKALQSQSRQQPVDWLPTLGKHCSFDIPGLVSFLGGQF